MATGFRDIPSLVSQMAVAKQIEAQDQAILANQIAAATQQEKLRQLQSPENQALLQLERQLQVQTMQQKLGDLQNPQAKLLRDVQEALALKAIDPSSGIISSPLGLEAETIATPNAISEIQQAALTGRIPSAGTLTAGQQEAFPQLLSAADQPRVATGQAIQPLTIAGRPTGFAQDINAAISNTEALSRAKGTTALERQLLANAQTEANRLSREQIAREGNVSRETIAATRSQGGGGLTGTRISIISGKAGEAGFTQEDIDERYTKEGVVDWNRVSLDSNRRIAENVKADAKIKASQLPASMREKASGFIAAHSDLGELSVTLKEFKATGKEPDAWERAVGVALESPPDGVMSALYQTVLGQGISMDARELNALKARVRSAVTKANAGLSQTEREIANVTQYSPTTNETMEQTLQKAAGLETYLRGQVKALTTDPREWLKTFETATGATPSPTTSGVTAPAPATVKSGNTFRIIR